MFDITNGAKCLTHWWSQTHSDIDVYIEVSADVRNGKSVSVSMTGNHLKVMVLTDSQWVSKVDDNLIDSINWLNSFWTLHPSQYIHISLVKTSNKWWNRLLVNETQVITGSSIKEIQFQDLSEEEKAVIERLTLEEKDKQKNRLAGESFN